MIRITSYLSLACVIATITHGMENPSGSEKEPKKSYLSVLPFPVANMAISNVIKVDPNQRDNRKDYFIEQGQRVHMFSSLAQQVWSSSIDERRYANEAVDFVRTHASEESYFQSNIFSALLAMPGTREQIKSRMLALLNSKVDAFKQLPQADKCHAIVNTIKICPEPEIIKTMIEAGAPVDIHDPGSLCSLLHYAVRHNEPNLVIFLLKAGAYPDAGDRLEYRPLHYAIIAGNYVVASLLLNGQAKPNLWDWYKNPALYYAVKNDDQPMAQLLIDHGASIYLYDSQELDDDIFERNLLAVAVANRSESMLTLLINARKSLGSVNNFFELMLNAALQVAAQKGYSELVTYILTLDTHIRFEKNEHLPQINPELMIANRTAISQALTNNHFGIAGRLARFSIDRYVTSLSKWLEVRGQSLKLAVEKRARLNPLERRYKAHCLQLDDFIDLMLADDTPYLNKLLPALCLKAAESGSRELTDRLLTYAQEYDTQAPAKVLLHAAAGGSALAVRNILQFPVSPCVSDSHGNTPVHKAVLLVNSQNLGLIHDLVQLGADIAATNNKGETPLHWAMKHPNKSDQQKVVKLIIEKFEQKDWFEHINACDNNGQTPLMLIAAKEDDSTPIIELLMAAGAQINVRDKKGRTALFLAANKNSLAHVEALLTYEADANIGNNSGCGPLVKAARYGNRQMIFSLLNADAHLKKFKNAMLREAVKDGHIDIMRWLLMQNADINGRSTSYGNTPLHKAATYKQLAAVRFLLKNGADKNAFNRMGNTPHDCALAVTDYEISQLLMPTMEKK